MMKLKRRSANEGVAGIAGAILLWASAFPTAAASFGAGIENSQWYLSESVFECSLVQEIPGFGRAVFSHRAGEDLAFHLESTLALMKPGRGQLVVEAPVWRPGVAPRPVGAVSVSDGQRSVSVGAREASIMAQGLLQGMQPTLTRASRFDQRPVRVSLSNVNFSAPYSGYLQCVSGLLPVNYDQIRRSRVPFASGGAKLSEADRTLLDNIVSYVRADSTIERILVDGHSDSIGSRIDNRALSEERANVVAEYLKARGIDEELLVVRSHGDQFPVSRRHRDNRRVTIRLQRQGERPELQQASGSGDRYSS
ncbi:flagellar protein MotY [Marinobacter litoralis]|uniref:flagellar protein MotY n=1 Tax=Marinobacter litoralis TaxID=187981 RepID=UPI0018EA3492|nr:OmpA family protein [Marinobacter litoralis]MBJ6138879.1 OmpA family protein [Marinobacter litoralis]